MTPKAPKTKRQRDRGWIMECGAFGLPQKIFQGVKEVKAPTTRCRRRRVECGPFPGDYGVCVASVCQGWPILISAI